MNVPVVTNRNMYPGTGVPWVMEDVADAARNLVRLLVGGLGHRHIRLIMARPFDPSAGLIRPSAILANALIQELHGVGIDLRPSDIVYSEYFWDKTAPAVRQWLTADRKPTAIISCDDNLAMKTLELAGELGLRVPQDLSVTTYGDIMPQSTLTAVHLPIRKIADQCVSILNQMLAGEKPQVAEFPAELIIRQTCGPANP
jgi:LacI family transcriptional regulator